MGSQQNIVGSGTDENGALAIRYSVDHGARVSSNSYGDSSRSSVMEFAIQYAATKGEVFVAAAGNNGANSDVNPFFPSALPGDNIISVAALNPDGSLTFMGTAGAGCVVMPAP